MSEFKFEKSFLKDAYLISGAMYKDERGKFSKCFEQNIFEEEGIVFDLSETFYSVSARNVLRGMHFQLKQPQAKIVSVLYGRVYDVIVDLRPNSPTFSKWEGYELSGENQYALYVPKGFAHGFVSLEDNTIMLYQCNGIYNKESDTGIRYDDSIIGINWPINNEQVICSNRDRNLMSFNEYIKKPMQI